ncbi:MAG: AAA family ATPase [Lachnospiraceae bacterium]|nr:AAA family ATPase [Lachnospiraceae bacterium]
MGIYLNPGYVLFEEAVNSEIFIDKTEMLLYLNSVLRTQKKYVSVSRPRRFGKTITANMLCAYYGKPDSTELFKRCKVSQHKNWDRYLGKCDVIRLVMTDYFKEGVDVEDALKKIQTRVYRDFGKVYPEVELDPDDFVYSMELISHESGKSFVIIIDEWDAIFRECKEDEKGQTRYLDFLRNWLKDKDYVALAYMTGILPIKKYGKHSALNMFDEYSIITPMQLAPYTGFTGDEVKELCRAYGRNMDKIKEWYDGYDVSDIIPPDPDHQVQRMTGKEIPAVHYSIYSPLSVVNAVTTGYIQNYWNKTETYEALAGYIRMNQDGLKDAVALMMDGGSVKADISTYQNDMTTFTSRDDVLALLINLGYLKYNIETKEVSIPNKEILDEFKTSTKSNEWVDTFQSFKTSLKLLDAIWTGDEETAAELMELAHDKSANKTYNDEAALSYGIQYAMYAAQKYYTTIQELDSGKGYADLVFLPSPKYPDKPALLMELKYDKDVKTAADQVRKRNYPQVLEHYKDNLLIVSVNYDKDAKGDAFKRHSCRIEKM